MGTAALDLHRLPTRQLLLGPQEFLPARDGRGCSRRHRGPGSARATARRSHPERIRAVSRPRGDPRAEAEPIVAGPPATRTTAAFSVLPSPATPAAVSNGTASPASRVPRPSELLAHLLAVPLSNALPLTCGAKRRQVQRLVRRRYGLRSSGTLHSVRFIEKLRNDLDSTSYSTPQKRPPSHSSTNCVLAFEPRTSGAAGNALI